VDRYQKSKTNLDFTEARDSEWQWHQLGYMQVCTSLQTDNHASTPPLSFFTGRMPFLPPNQQRQSTEGTKSTEGTTHSAQNLCFVFDEHLTFSDQISFVSKSYHIRQLRCIRPYLDTKTANAIATSIVHSKLDYCNSLLSQPAHCPSLRSPVSNRSRTLLHVLLSKLPNPVTSLPSFGLYTLAKDN